MELFTFLRVGGDPANLKFYEVPNEKGETGARAALGYFEAGKAQCFLKRDRSHLLAVIEAGFGDLTPFNQLVMRLFHPDGEAAVKPKKRGLKALKAGASVAPDSTPSPEPKGGRVRTSPMP